MPLPMALGRPRSAAGLSGILAAVLLATTFNACNTGNMKRPDVHGHRGCRALLPENTVAGFLKAAGLGCDWLEMDVVITADSAVLVSHEPWMDHRICRTPEGDSIPPALERTFNIHRMGLAEVQAFDCGSAPHPDFPDQENAPAMKPTLRQVVEAVDEQVLQDGTPPPGYSIEIKSDPALYGTFQPMPEAFAARVLAEIAALGIEQRCIVQSFDPAVLEAVHRLNEYLPTSLLVENRDGLEANLRRLSFTPTYYSPDHELVDRDLVQQLAEKGIALLVWTVNDRDEMERMIQLGADGIITDEPGRLVALLDAAE